jgi:hypothetical protein
MTRLRDRLVDGPNSLGAGFRSRRWQTFLDLFPDVDQMRVLDLGGRVESWRRAPVLPQHVTVVNLEDSDSHGEGWATFVHGDATNLPAAARGEYDLVFSNSLVEHVGGHGPRARLAETVEAMAPRHWVQCPYRYFPIEPHWIFPGMQFLPLRARIAVAMHWPLVNTRPATVAQASGAVMWTELISATEMKLLFPNSRLIFERVLGIRKSMIVVKGHTGS